MGPVFPILEQGPGQFQRQVGLFYYDDTKDHIRSRDLYCLRLYRTTINPDAKEVFSSRDFGLLASELPNHPIPCVVVMLLAPVNLEQHTFRRVGLGEIHAVTWFDSCQNSQLTIV